MKNKCLILLLGVVFLLGLTACSSEPEYNQDGTEPPGQEDDGHNKQEIALIDFDGFRISSISPVFELITYNVSNPNVNKKRHETIYDIEINYNLIKYNTKYTFYLSYKDGSFYDFQGIDEQLSGDRSATFTPEGYLSGMKYEIDIYHYGHTYSYTEIWKREYSYKYNDSGNVTEVYGNVKYIREEGGPPKISENETFQSFIWENGNLVSITSTFLESVEGESLPPYTVTHNISYNDKAENTFFQYPMSLALLFDGSYYSFLGVPLGLMGKGPVNIPTSVETVDRYGEKTIKPIDITMGDIINGKTVIVKEEYEGITYEFTYEPANTTSEEGLKAKKTAN